MGSVAMANESSTGTSATISVEKQYEYITRQIQRNGDTAHLVFRHYVQVYSAIVGGSIWLSMQSNVSTASRTRFAWLSDGLVILLTVVAVVSVVDALRAWRANRIAQSKLGRPGEIPLPRIPPSGVAEIAILLVIIAACCFFCAFNPFSEIKP